MKHSKEEAERIWWAHARERARMYEAQLHERKKEALDAKLMAQEDVEAKRGEQRLQVNN